MTFIQMQATHYIVLKNNTMVITSLLLLNSKDEQSKYRPSDAWMESLRDVCCCFTYVGYYRRNVTNRILRGGQYPEKYQKIPPIILHNDHYSYMSM